jgi:hypothetical protein
MVADGQTRLTDGKSCLLRLLRSSKLTDGPDDTKPSATTLGGRET